MDRCRPRRGRRGDRPAPGLRDRRVRGSLPGGRPGRCRAGSPQVSPRTTSNGSSTSGRCVRGGNVSRRVRPIIMRTISSSRAFVTSTVPTLTPSRKIVARWQRSRTSSMRCEMKTTATPSAHRRRTTAKTCCTWRRLSAEVASSRISTFGCRRMALAISINWRSARERSRTTARGSIPTKPRPTSQRRPRVACACRRPDPVWCAAPRP